MKKFVKIISLICILSIVCVLAVACKSADAQKQVWFDKEVFVYSVLDTTGQLARTGTLTMTTERLNNVDISAGNYQINGFIGTMVSWELVMDANSENDVETINAKSWFTNSQVPKLSYKKYNLASNTTEIAAKYETDTYRYTIDGTEKTLSIKKGATLVDNESLYIVLRTYDLDFSSFSASFSIPSPQLAQIEPMAVKTGTGKTLTVPFGTFDTILVGVSVNSKFSGRAFAVYYASKPYVYSASGLTRSMEYLPVQIEENGVIYSLESVTCK